MKYFFLFLSFFIIQFTGSGQNIDSLKQNLLSQKNDTHKVNAYFDLANALYVSDPELANRFCDSALALSENLKYPYGIAESCGWISYFLQTKGKSREALPYELKALAIREKTGDKKGISTSLNNIGYIYESIGDLKQAIEHYEKCLEMRETMGDEIAIANVLNNLGYMNDISGEKEKALLYYLRSLNILEKTDDKPGIARQYHNIAAIYFDNKKAEKGIETIKKAISLNKEAKNFEGLIANYNLLANFYLQINKLENALETIREGEKLATEHHYPNLLKPIKNILHNIYKKKGDYKLALEYFRSFAELRDSLLRAENNKQFAESEAKYQNGKKQLEIDNLNKTSALNRLEIENKETKINQQKFALLIAIVGFLIVLAFSFYINKALKEKKRANELLTAQKKETEIQKHLVEEHQKEIIDSIRYAKRIQDAMLPSPGYLSQEFKRLNAEAFILFKPKDIVSGDFYWLYAREDVLFFIAADCTGHGVPGGFMSMLGINLLNEIVNERKISDPGAIFNILREQITNSLMTDEGYTKDGMDAVFCRIDFSTYRMEYASANNSFYVLRKKEIVEMASQKMPVGYQESAKPFETFFFQLEKGDVIYSFTDGFADQFGGPKGKKFMYRRFEALLSEISSRPMADQKGLLEKAFVEWKGKLEQVDDVTVIGIRVCFTEVFRPGIFRNLFFRYMNFANLCLHNCNPYLYSQLFFL